MAETFSIKKRVEFGDTDMAGIVHFSNYCRYMEVAETSFLNALGLSVTWEEQGVRYGFPRVSVNLDFQRPVKFGEEIDIQVIVDQIGRKSVTYRFLFSKDQQPVATGKIVTVYCRSNVNHQMESLELSAAIREKLRRFLAS